MSKFQYRPEDPTNPAHYRQDGVETIDKMIAMMQRVYGAMWQVAFLGHCQCNALKYCDRAGLKGTEDTCMGKAAWYLQMGHHMCVDQMVPDPRSGVLDAFHTEAKQLREALRGEG